MKFEVYGSDDLPVWRRREVHVTFFSIFVTTVFQLCAGEKRETLDFTQGGNATRDNNIVTIVLGLEVIGDDQ